ncbi:HepT-like ribonuclease domain-containing protein [Hymenobacter rubripertinctus]|uniref:DUF86 domain-containing protein n=1 Tax=Hymenobacter rubripertinctus TaxID=2029981 RepID=A0A418R941_9BACT|nr:HepT-like ribonuclease domain-containing protein [Hymenobacter rubripertinctus]RIY13909.1 DUF86 domain-containing protein [Hymenobacter rubripertinctus]
MGKAVGRIMKLAPYFQLSNARQIIATRNRIIHGYDTVSDEMTWSIVVRHLPQLKQEVTTSGRGVVSCSTAPNDPPRRPAARPRPHPKRRVTAAAGRGVAAETGAPHGDTPTRKCNARQKVTP